MLGMPPSREAGQSGRNQMQWLPWKYDITIHHLRVPKLHAQPKMRTSPKQEMLSCGTNLGQLRNVRRERISVWGEEG